MSDLVKKDPKMQFAKEIASSNLVPTIPGKPADIYSQSCSELGLSPIQCCRILL